ncbi:MAG: Trm112 family protein [Candidatus Bipolaricaulaceae bacterium]|uniref:Trm112 family protein n=1 Tax=Candidatus Hadarchaeum sp. TaxID=2883567 RepID=UPI003D1420E7
MADQKQSGGTGSDTKKNTVDPELLEIFACPKYKSNLGIADDGSSLICRACQSKYPVEEGIPLMLIDKAIPLCQEDL